MLSVCKLNIVYPHYIVCVKSDKFILAHLVWWVTAWKMLGN